MRASLAAILALLGPIVVFAMLPGAGMFVLLYVPIWLVVGTVVIGIGYAAAGQRGVVAGSFILVAVAIASFVQPLASQDAACWTSPRAPSRFVAMPARIVIDNVDPHFSVYPDRYTLQDRIALLNRIEVVQFSRRARGHLDTVFVSKAISPDDCSNAGGGSLDRRLDRCLERTKVMDFGHPLTTELPMPDIGPTLEFVGTFGSSCSVVSVYERRQGSRALVARFVDPLGKPVVPAMSERVRAMSGPRTSTLDLAVLSVLRDDVVAEAYWSLPR